MARFRRIYGDSASSSGAIFAPISRLNKPPVSDAVGAVRLTRRAAVSPRRLRRTPDPNHLLRKHAGTLSVRSRAPPHVG
jgi:hypothetical protein